MRKQLLRITCLALIATMFTPAMGQSIEEQIRDLAENNAEGYLGAFPSLFGTAMNTGVFRTAKPHKLLGFDLTLNLMAVTVPEADKTFEFALLDQIVLPIGDTGESVTLNSALLYANANLEAPTFFGSSDAHRIVPDGTYLADQVSTALGGAPVSPADLSNITNALTYELSGANINAVPMIVPQFSLGLIKDIEVTFGGFSIPLGDDNDFKFSRIGGKIGINQFIPTIPLVFPAISLGFYSTSMTVGDVLEAKNTILSLQASKSVPILTLYGGFGIESSKVDIKLNAPDGTNLLDFSLEGENSFRTTIGVRIKLLLLSINADYNMGKYPSANAGIGLTFR